MSIHADRPTDMGENSPVLKGADAVSDQTAELNDGAVRVINRLMTARAYWKIPERVLLSVPERLAKYIEKLDPETEARAFDRAIRLMCRLIDQNIAQGRQEVQFLGQAHAQPQEADVAPVEAPELPAMDKPSLANAEATARILAEYGILQKIAESAPEVLEGEAEHHE